MNDTTDKQLPKNICNKLLWMIPPINNCQNVCCLNNNSVYGACFLQMTITNNINNNTDVRIVDTKINYEIRPSEIKP
jgi:hypothetical protein